MIVLLRTIDIGYAVSDLYDTPFSCYYSYFGFGDHGTGME